MSSGSLPEARRGVDEIREEGIPAAAAAAAKPTTAAAEGATAAAASRTTAT